MVKGFIRLTKKHSGFEIYVRGNIIKAILPLKSIAGYDETTEGSAVYLEESSLFDENYFCVMESPKSVMTLMEMEEMAKEI